MNGINDALQELANSYLAIDAKKGAVLVPGRVQAAIVLLERLREFPIPELASHTTDGGASVISHESLGRIAHERLNLVPLNTNHGRRSSNLPDWGPRLLSALKTLGVLDADDETRISMIDFLQAQLGRGLRDLLEQAPLSANLKGRTVEAVVREVLEAAEQKRQSGNVAQYLIGAKLELRFGAELPVVPANKSDRKTWTDPDAKLGDFQFEDTVIEVAIGPYDEKHLEQIAYIATETNYEAWLLTRSDRVAGWKNEIDNRLGPDSKRVVVSSVEAFVGQNISEIGGFSSQGVADGLAKLFQIYNERWVAKVGFPGIRIELR